jgi:hypothetical protein
MATKLPHLLSLGFPAYHVVNFHGVPMWRAQAWALKDYELHSGKPLIVNSAIRTDSVIKDFNRKHGTHLHGQQYLYDAYWVHHLPGFFPANKPNQTSHCGFSDGNHYYRVRGKQIPAGHRLPDHMWGIDATNEPGGDSAHIVSWLNSHGYHAKRPYNTDSERHHFMFTASPAGNARKRLAAHYAGRPHKR